MKCKDTALFGLLVSALLFLFSCEEYDKNQVTVAGGKLDQVMILMDDSLVETELSNHLVNEFQKPIPVMPQAEPRFLLNIRDFSRYQKAASVFHKYRNLGFLALVEGNAPATQFVRKQLGDEKVKEMMQKDQLFTTRKNEFAQNQQVIYMVAASQEKFYELFEAQKEKLFATIRKLSNKRLDRQTFLEGRNNRAEKSIQEAFDISIKVPEDFMLLRDSSDAVWLNKETVFHNKQNEQVRKIREDIYITSYAGQEKEKFLNSTAPQVREKVELPYPYVIMDSIASNNIYGKSEKYPIYIDKRQYLFQQQRTINGIEVLDSRGLWRCDMPLMGGFAYTISFEHPRTNELVVLFGFVYAAGSDKRPIHRKYDVIFNSLNIPQS